MSKKELPFIDDQNITLANKKRFIQTHLFNTLLF